MVDKEIKVKVTTEADISNLEDLSDLVNDIKGNAEVELNVNTNDESLDGTQSKVEELEQEFNEATNRVEELQDALDQAHLEGDDIEADIIADELAEAEAEAERLGEALDNISGSGVDDITSGAEELAESLDNATSSSEGLSESMGLIDSAVMMDMANQVGMLGGQAESMAQDMNTAAISVGQLATQTGIAEPQMISLINNISNVTFPQDEAMAYVEALNQMHISADQLGDSATNMDKINDAFHLGYNNVISLTRGLANVGVDANNLDASFNALAYAQSNVNGGVETLNTGLRRQGATFNELGLNIDQVAVIMSGASKKWTDARQLNSGLSKALKNCNGDLRALEQELGLQAGALDKASQYTGQYSGQLQQLADEEMEHKTWLERITAGYEDLQLSLTPVLSPISSFIGLMGSFGQTALGINSILTLAETFGLLNTAELALIPTQIAEGAAGWFSVGWIAVAVVAGLALGAALAYLYNNSEDFREAVDWLGQSLMDTVGIIDSYLLQTINMIIPTLQGVWEYIFTLGGLLPAEVDLTGNQIINSVLRVMAFMFTLPAQIGIIFMNIIARALGFKGNFVQNLVSAATSGVSGFVNAIQSIPKAIQSCLDWARSVVLNHPIVQTLKWLGEQAAYAFSVVGLRQRSPGKIVKALRNELNWAEEAVRGSTLTNTIATLGADMSNEFNPNLNTISNASSNIPVNNGGDIIVNVYGDIDNDKRIRELVDAVRRELNWNNTTAGRTI